MTILRFFVKSGVCMIEFSLNGKTHIGAIISQAGKYYASTGNALLGTLKRHPYSTEQTAAVRRFLGSSSTELSYQDATQCKKQPGSLDS